MVLTCCVCSACNIVPLGSDCNACGARGSMLPPADSGRVNQALRSDVARGRRARLAASIAAAA